MMSSVHRLRDPGSLLLVSTYELGHQPLAIASAFGFLDRAGYAADTLDLAVERFDEGKVARARFLGVSVPMHTALRLGVRVAARVREINADCHVCLFGLYATLNAEHLLRKHGVDSVLGGEFEAPLVALVEALDVGRPIDTPGVGLRGHPAGANLERLNFPVPIRTSLPSLEMYARLDRDGALGLVGYVEATRGCKHLCLHCPIPPVYGGRFFTVPRKVVLEDVRRLVRMGAVHITFGDPDFLNGPRHSLRIVRALHEEFPSLTYDFTAKIEHVLKHSKIFLEFAATGCLFVVSAVESLSDTVLATLEKGHIRADVFQALEILRNSGIALRPSFVAFTPWTTISDYLEVLNVVEAEALIDHVDPIQYAVRLLIPPGSHLLSRPAIQPFLGELEEESFTYHWTHPDPRMDALHGVVSRLVEEAIISQEDTAVTFQRIKAAALAARGRSETCATVSMWPLDRKRPPRLTESWFC